MNFQHTDCFKIILKYWNFLGIWSGDNSPRFYKYYTIIFISLFVFLYDTLLTVNIYFLPLKIDAIIEESIFFFMQMAVLSKVVTFIFMREKIDVLFETLEYDVFKPETDKAFKIVEKAKQFIKKYWKIVAAVSYASNLTHISTPFIAHLLLPISLELPVCSYSFLPDKIKKIFIYPLYFYQGFGMHCQMLYNINIDSFFLGLIILSRAQLEVLDYKLRHITDYDTNMDIRGTDSDKEEILLRRLNQCIIHFDEITKFVSLVEEVFSVTLLIQFSMASCILCICLFRFTLPAESSYYVFLATYMIAMTSQIAVPCWFGTQVMETSNDLSVAVYNCDWTPRPRQFKSNLRLLVTRTNKPVTIIGGKMFPLSLTTFSSIANSAYSFFTLLRHMQTRES